jgi:hypothetical protein
LSGVSVHLPCRPNEDSRVGSSRTVLGVRRRDHYRGWELDRRGIRAFTATGLLVGTVVTVCRVRIENDINAGCVRAPNARRGCAHRVITPGARITSAVGAAPSARGGEPFAATRDAASTTDGNTARATGDVSAASGDGNARRRIFADATRRRHSSTRVRAATVGAIRSTGAPDSRYALSTNAPERSNAAARIRVAPSGGATNCAS